MVTVKPVIVFIVKTVDCVMQKNAHNADKVILYGLVFVGKTGDDYSDNFIKIKLSNLVHFCSKLFYIFASWFINV